MALDPIPLDLIPPFSFGPALSFLLDITLLGLALGALLCGLTVHALRLRTARARERAQIDHPPALDQREHVVLTGTIDGRGDGAPIRAILRERRSELDDSSWHEAHREIQARSFQLETTTGVVHVEPGSSPLVVSEIDEVRNEPSGERVRVAALEHGSTILAYGSLHREKQPFAGYRGGEGWTLRAARGRRLLLADGALTTRYDARIRVLERFTLVALPAWLVFHALFSSAFLFASFFGRQTRTELVDITTPAYAPTPWLGREIQTENKDGEAFTSRVSESTFLHLQELQGVTLPLLQSPWKRACFVGGEASTSALAVGGGLFVAALALLRLRVRYRHSTPWYDRS